MKDALNDILKPNQFNGYYECALNIIFSYSGIQVIPNSSTGQSFQPGNSTSTIHVSVSDNSKRSYSFQGFETMDCILNGEFNW